MEQRGLRRRVLFPDLEHPVVSSYLRELAASAYRETGAAIAAAKRERITCVEMEAAALYAYAAATGRAVVCLAHVTNAMARAGDDFEKGVDNGVHDALAVARATAVALL